jgi:hypothetical protein
VVAAGGLEGEIGQDVGREGAVVDLVGGAQGGGEVALGQAVVSGVEGHPSGELSDFAKGVEEPGCRVRGVPALMEEQGDRAELSADVRQVAGAAVLVVQLLEEGQVLLDLLDERIRRGGAGETVGVRAAADRAVQVVRDDGEQGAARGGEKVPAVSQPAVDPVLHDPSQLGGGPWPYEIPVRRHEGLRRRRTPLP